MSDVPTPTFPTLSLEVDGGIGRLVLNRPHRLNALSPQAMQDIIAASGWLAALPELRVALVAGEGRAFCAGFDLDEMRGAAETRDKATADLGQRMVEAVEAIPAITVALVQGHCVGGGLLLAAACDLRVATAEAHFSIPELEIGIPLAWGGVPRLVRLVGPTVAMELVLDCGTFDAVQALNWRLINRVVPEGALAEYGQEWAERLARHPLTALRITKQRFSEVSQALCTSAGSEVDAEGLLAVLKDPETHLTQQRYIASRRG